MKVLIATHHYFDLAGSETFAYTLAKTLMFKGCTVAIYSPYIGGIITEKTIQLGIPVFNHLQAIKEEKFDVIHLSHNLVAIEMRFYFPNTPIIFVSHGVLPFLEQPPLEDLNISKFLGVSEEVKDNLMQKGIPSKSILIFRNIIDTQRFSPSGGIGAKPRGVLVNSRKMDQQTKSIVTEACKRLGLETEFIGNPGNIEWDVERHINQADICISLGRGILEAMSCGRAAIVFDYDGGDGLVTVNNIDEIQKCNFSGRRFKKRFSVETLMEEIKKYAEPTGMANRGIIEERFSAEKNVNSLIDLYGKAIRSFEPKPLMFDRLNHLKNLITETRTFSFETERRRYEGVIRDKESAVIDLQRALQSNDQNIAKLQVSIGEKESDIGHLNETMAQKDFHMARLEGVVREKDSDIGHLNETIAQKDFRIARLEGVVREKDSDIGRLNETMAQRDSRIARLEGVVGEKETQTKGLMAGLIEKDRELGVLKETISERDFRVSELINVLSERDGRIFPLENEVREKKAEAEGLRVSLAEKEREIGSLKEAISQKDANIVHLESVAREKEDSLNHIHNSHGWKALLIYYRVRDKILPMNTRRRVFAKTIFKMIINLRGMLKNLNKRNPKKLSDSFITPESTIIEEKIRKKVPDGSGVSEPSLIKVEFERNISEGRIEDITFPYYDQVLVSIVIPVWNKWPYTHRCLRSIFENTKDVPYEIILANDASTDETFEMLRKAKGINIINNPINLGFIKNCNNAINQAKGKYILLLNNDTEVTHGWLANLVEIAESDDKVGVVGGKVLYPDGRLQEAGSVMDAEGWGQPYGRFGDPNGYEYNYLKETDFITGACLLIRKDIFLKLGGFDERYTPAFYEEFDLEFAIREAGYKIIYQPRGVIVHHQTSSYGPEIRDSLSSINHAKFMEKWANQVYGQIAQRDIFPARDRSIDKKVILVIDEKIPDYDKNAGSLTIYQYIRLFQEIGFKVIYIPDSLVPLEPYMTELQQVGIEVVYGQFDFESWIKQNGSHIHYAWLSRPQIAIKYIDAMKRYSKAKICYYTHDLHYLRELRRYEIEKKKEILEESNRVKKDEFYLFENVDVILTPSNYEQKVIKEIFTDKQVVTIPAYYYDVDSADKTIEGSFDGRNGLIFLGGFGHLPNVDAVKWFVNEIFPAIKKEVPEIKFYIVGSNPPPEITSLSKSDIIVTGYVRDLSPLFQKCRVFVCPLRYGAGVKGKTVLSMYYGVPVISTKIGNEGLNLEHCAEAFIADDPVEFAKWTVELYTNPKIWAKFSENSLRFVKNNFSKDKAKRVIFEAFMYPTVSIGGKQAERPKSELRDQTVSAIHEIRVKSSAIQDDDFISTTSTVERDLTQGTDYRKLTDEEIKHYSNVEVTETLTEGGLQNTKPWRFYFEYLTRNVFGRSFHDEVAALANQFEHPRLLSLGCGYGGHDLHIARMLRKPFELVAVDLNPRIFAEAERRAASEGLNIRFTSLDLNFIDIRPGAFDVIYASASLHHILNLEHMFSQLHQGLKDYGRLVVMDVIGKTQVIFWRENVEFATGLVKRMPLRYRPSVEKRFWRHLRFDPHTIIPKYIEPSTQVGMEGIRQEEIEPLMTRWFTPIKLFKYNAYMRMICTNQYLGARLDPGKKKDRQYLEKLIRLEFRQIESGKLRPTEMFGVFKKGT